MKHYYLSFFIATLMSMACNMASAHDIAVANSNGKTIYYNYNSDGSSVSVTYQGAGYSSYSNEYTGTVVIPETVTYSGQTYSVTSIGSYAFYGCNALTSVTIPNSVTSIGALAFKKCSSLAEVTLSDGETILGIDGYVFVGCSIEQLYLGRNLSFPKEFSGNPFLKNVVIGNNVTSIGNEAFWSCNNLVSIDIPNSVICIGDSAFWGCSSLTKVIIPNKVTTIGSYTFKSCHSLASVTIPNSVTSISNSAFEGCFVLSEVIIPSVVTNIGEYAFFNCNTTKVISLNVTPPKISSGTFYNKRSITLYVPKGCIEIYSTAPYWEEFFDIKEYTDDNTFIGDVNNDGSITMADANAVVNYFLTPDKSNIVNFNVQVADVNGDGYITMADANAIVNMFLTKNE